MMDEFNNQLDSAELDPRAKWKAAAKTICERELAGVPGEIAEEIARSHLRELGKHLRECLEEGRIADGNQWIAQLELGMRNAIRWERQSGRLKPVSPTSEIERSLPALPACGYQPIEIDSILALLGRGEPGERITEIGIRVVKTSKRSIGRGELVNVLKSSTSTNGKWEQQFPSDRELRELEAAEEARQNPQGLYSDYYNHDLPSPFSK
jgi:hypothetical protein